MDDLLAELLAWYADSDWEDGETPPLVTFEITDIPDLYRNANYWPNGIKIENRGKESLLFILQDTYNYLFLVNMKAAMGPTALRIERSLLTDRLDFLLTML